MVSNHCSGLLGRTPLRQFGLPSLSFGGFHCSGLLGRTPLRPVEHACEYPVAATLFRPLRPDSIETGRGRHGATPATPDCSGLLGRTPLRRLLTRLAVRRRHDCSGLLGRTPLRQTASISRSRAAKYCSGLLGRTPLRPVQAEVTKLSAGNCSGLLGRTPLRHWHDRWGHAPRRIVPAS